MKEPIFTDQICQEKMNILSDDWAWKRPFIYFWQEYKLPHSLRMTIWQYVSKALNEKRECPLT